MADSGEDFTQHKQQQFLIGEATDFLSVTEIDERITLLEKEIKRLQQARNDKGKSRAAADALFR